jgi:EmrB/QacA subfamily drug resistance transporter
MTSSPALTHLDPQLNRKRWTALVVLCVGMLMIILDQTIVNVALPSIQDDLGFSQSSLAWVINAYLIAFGGLLLLAGRIGDLVGPKRVFMAGLGVFVGASLLCGIADSESTLVAARFIQGVGGALTAAVILGMIVTMFPEPAERAKAIGVYSFVAAAGGSLGLLLGGVITEAINWHWIFFVNVPIGVATAVAAVRLVEGEKGIGIREGADALGAVLLVGALMLGVYTIVEAGNYGWGSLHTLGLGGISAALMAGFVLREHHAAAPLMPLRIFRSRNVSGANVVQMLMVAGFLATFFLGAIYLQRVLGYDSLEVGLAFLPVATLIGILSLGFSARLNMRFGPRATLIPGLTLILAGLLYFSRSPVDASYLTDVLPAMLLLGLGAGLSFPSLMNLAMSGAHQDDAGLASGLVNTTMQVGGALGLAVIATLASSRTESLVASGSAEAQALTGGFHLAFLVGAGLVVAAIGLALSVLEPLPAPALEEAGEEAPAAEFAEAYPEAA